MKEYIFEISDKTTVDGGHPAVKKEEIVRCKDCKYFHDYGDGVKNCWGDGGGMKDDDYCSQAKRKDE